MDFVQDFFYTNWTFFIHLLIVSPMANECQKNITKVWSARPTRGIFTPIFLSSREEIWISLTLLTKPYSGNISKTISRSADAVVLSLTELCETDEQWNLCETN